MDGNDWAGGTWGQAVELHVLSLAAEEEPAVAELLQKIGIEDELLRLTGRERLVRYPQRLLVCNIIIKRIKQAQALQVRDTVEMDNRLTVVLCDSQLVLKAADDIAHFRELLKVLQLPEHVNGFLHDLIVVLRHGHIRYAVLWFRIAIVLALIHLDGCVVAQLSDRIIWYIDTPWLGDRYNLTMVAGSDKFEIE